MYYILHKRRGCSVIFAKDPTRVRMVPPGLETTICRPQGFIALPRCFPLVHSWEMLDRTLFGQREDMVSNCSTSLRNRDLMVHHWLIGYWILPRKPLVQNIYKYFSPNGRRGHIITYTFIPKHYGDRYILSPNINGTSKTILKLPYRVSRHHGQALTTIIVIILLRSLSIPYPHRYVMHTCIFY